MFSAPPPDYTPRQLYQFQGEGLRSQTRRPEADLAGCVYYYWLLHIDAASFELDVIPDNAMDLVLSPDIADFAALYFPVDKPFRLTLNGPVRYAGISLRAEQASMLFGKGLAALKSLEPGIETASKLDLMPTIAAIQGAGEFDEIAAELDLLLRNRCNGARPPRLHGAIDHLLKSLEPAGIATVAGTLGISERQFRRLSSDLIGLPPKKLQRVLRLQNLLAELFDADAPQLRSGYYDDAHLIRELKALTGLTPGKIRAMAEKYNPD